MSLSTSSEDGVLRLPDVDYLVPWLFVRALFRDVRRAVETVLEVIVAADDAPKVDSPTKFFSSEGMDVTRMSLNLDLRMGSSGQERNGRIGRSLMVRTLAWPASISAPEPGYEDGLYFIDSTRYGRHDGTLCGCRHRAGTVRALMRLPSAPCTSP